MNLGTINRGDVTIISAIFMIGAFELKESGAQVTNRVYNANPVGHGALILFLVVTGAGGGHSKKKRKKVRARNHAGRNIFFFFKIRQRMTGAGRQVFTAQ